MYIELLKVNNKRDIYVTKPQLDDLITACKCDETKSMLKILYYTGMRIGEVLRATPLGEVLVVSDTKNNKAAYIPMHPEVAKLIAVFPFKYKYHYYRDRFAEARLLVGRPDLHIHDIRHSTASALIRAGASMVEVRDTLRHSNIATTNRYLHLCNEGVRRTINRL
jgi:integrase